MNASSTVRRALAGLPLVLSLQAQAANDLLADWRAATAHDPGYAAARADYQAGLAKAEQARALWRPSVVASANLGWVDQRSATTGAGFVAPGFGNSTDVAFRTQIDNGTAQGWNLTLQQPLLNADRSASARQLDLQTALAEQQLRLAEQSLILRVAQAHFDVLSAREALKAARSEQTAAQHALGEAQERFAAGGTPVTAVHEAQARADLIAAQLLAAQDALELANAAYADLTGLPPEQAADLNPQAPAVGPAGTLDDWLKRAQAQSPQLAAARVGADIAQAGIARHDAWRSPTLDLVARAGEDRMHGSGPYATADSARYNSGVRWIGLQLNVPLYTGGMRSAQRDEAVALAEKARDQSEAARLDVTRKTRVAWLAASTGVARVHALEQARLSAAKRLDATQTGYEVGDRTVLDLLDAERDLHANELALQQAREALLLGRLNLAASVGALDEAALREVNGALGAVTDLPQTRPTVGSAR